MATENHAIGLHLSKWQGYTDMLAIKQQGFDFVYSRIGIGFGTYIDETYAENLAKARAVRLPFGGYFVPSFPGYDINPDDHINNLENGIESADGMPDFLVDDIEKFSGTPLRSNTRENIYQISLRMLDYMKDDNRVWQYTRANLWNEYVGDGVLAKDPGPNHNVASDYPLHIAHYPSREQRPWREVIRPSFMPNIPAAWIDSTTRKRGKFTGWKVWQVYDQATGVEGVASNESAIELMKLAFFELLFAANPNPISNPEPKPEPTPTGKTVRGTFEGVII